MNKYSIQKSFTINAGAGTGKTYTLSRRYINAILGFDLFASSVDDEFFYTEQNSKNVENILTLTYTNAAANEMKSRIFTLMQDILDDRLSGIDKARFEKVKNSNYIKQTLKTAIKNMHKVNICTFHSFATKLLKEQNPFFSFELLDDELKNKCFNELYFELLSNNEKLVKELDLNTLNEFCKAYIFDDRFRQICKNFKLDEIEYEYLELKKIDIDYLYQNADILGDKKDLALGVLDGVSDEILRKSGTMEQKEYIEKLKEFVCYKRALNVQDEFVKLFEIMLKLANELRQNYEQLAKNEKFMDFDMLINKFIKEIDKLKDINYIMFDEFQDTNEEQYSIINKLNNANIFSVGDIKQSIYAFAGANVDVYKNAIKDLEQVFMNDNYRSSKEILNIINQITRKLFSHLKDTDLNAKNDNLKGGSISYIVENSDERYENTAKFLAQVDDIYKLNKDDKIAVMFDTRAQMNNLAKKLDEFGVKYCVDDNTKFYERTEINHILNLIFALYDIKNKKEDEKYTNYEKLALFNDIFNLNDDDRLRLIKSNDFSVFSEFKSWFESLSLSEFLVHLYYEKGFYDVFSDEKSRANLDEFLDEIIKLESKKSKENIIKELKKRKQTSTKSQAKFVNNYKINLCTIHSTKGLEYEMVVLMNANKALGVNNSSLKISENYIGFKIGDEPSLSYELSKNQAKKQDIDENKRLLYVAITRAIKHIVLSYTLSKTKPNDNSFLAMLDELYKDESMICKDLKDLGEKLLLDEISPCKQTSPKQETIKLNKLKIDKHITTATNTNSVENLNTKIGSCVHKMIEKFHEHSTNEILMGFINECELSEYKDKIIGLFNNYINSNLAKKVAQSSNKYYELEINTPDKTGICDLIYYDNDCGAYVIVDFKTGKKSQEKENTYQKQLEFYKSMMENEGYKIAKTEIFWLENKND
ncbi:UvrD-helicase domain-containing protein [Campylobacter sp. RM12654]|uniref:UvrD-helicase domain-containing protein n=1 Tax=Campylobacter sp. RM12654 TaxID=2735738 RepID=UPI003015416A|nr:UvrD-helicase domain-containing protein [Campylobacter sp. RM12654]